MVQGIRKNRLAFLFRQISILSILMAVCLPASPQNSDEQAARQFAEDFFQTRKQNISRRKSAGPKAEIKLSYQSSEKAHTPLYVFQQEDAGFAMLAKTQNQFKILGYSDESTFLSENLPPPLRALMDYYEDSLTYTNALPENLQAGTPVVPALLYEHGIKLNQYNHPEVGGSYTGCMATAFTQILLFHAAEKGTTVKGFDSHCYTYSDYEEICADFQNANYSSEELLSYHVAIALDMRFTTGGSSPPPGVDVSGSLEKYFHCFAVSALSEDFYLKNELDHRRPLYATMIGKPENHAVVIDGYDDQNYFHLNFGWGGSFNGYFQISNSSWVGTGSGLQQYYTNFPILYLMSPDAIPVNEQDSLALVSLHHALGGMDATHWDLSKPVWTWPGVVIMNDRVIRLTIGSNIPPATANSIASEIGNLSALQELNLYGCFNGTIPSSLTQLTDLKRINIANKTVYVAPELHKGNLKWSFPEDIDKLTKLEWFSVSNILEGNIPASIGNLPELKHLYIWQDTGSYGRGKITGSLPGEISHLDKLQQLHITDQQLTGNLPGDLADFSELITMDLSGNMLSGPVPELNMPKLQYLILDDNLFSEFSEGNGNCPKLTNMELQNNQLSGSIPSWFGNFTELKSLNLSDNQLESLPEELGNLTKLESLKADNNQLALLPDGLALNIQLKHLSASNNQIAYIPDNLGQSRSLVTLNLSDNQITSIPEYLGSCPELYEIILSNNKIESIPPGFENVRDAVIIYLNNNEIKGKIPEKLLTSDSENNRYVNLTQNRFSFDDIPQSEHLKFGASNQKNVSLEKQVFHVQVGDTVSIDIRSISGLAHPDNEYYWLEYPELISLSHKNDQISGIENNPVLKRVIDEKSAGKQYYCKVFNPNTPSFSFYYEGSIYHSPCMDYLNTDFLELKLSTDEEIIAENYPDDFVTSLGSLEDNTVADGTVTLVPPLKIKRGSVEWEASTDGISWVKISESMQEGSLKDNILSFGKEKLVLNPVNTAFYRCRLNEYNCDPMYSEALQVKAPGILLFDELIDVREASRLISVDSIEVFVPENFHESEFRLRITKLENPPAFPANKKAGSAYDVSVSFGDSFEIPLLIKLKNIDKTKITDTEIDYFQAVYFDEKNRDWKLFDHAHLSLIDSSLVFTTHHLTKISWWWAQEIALGYTDYYERNNVRVFYKEGDTDFMKFGYARKQTTQEWHVSEIPLLIQDITEFLPKVMARYKFLGLEVPDGKFSVYVKQMDDAGCVGLLGMLSGYMLIDANMSNPVELRQVLAHEYMHYTQDYYIAANPGNSFWMEAHATLADRMVWNDEEVPLCEPEQLLQSGRTSKISIFHFLANSWDYWDKSTVTNNLLGNIHYNYLAGTFLHYMRNEREYSEKLEPATLLKETSWLGSWRSYLGSYVNKHLEAVLGNEYEDYVKYILSGKNENFSLINTNGNPYAFLQDPKNREVFTFPVSYSFSEGEDMVQKDEIAIKVPYMAAKIVLLENNHPDTLVLVNYQRRHDADDKHRVYHVSYDAETREMEFVDISDSAEYNFLLEARNTENSLTTFRNYSLLLLINKEYIGVSALIDDFDASFELTAMPVMDIERIGMLDIYKGNSPHLHSFDNRQEYIAIGTPDASFIQTVTEFNVRFADRSTSKRMLKEGVYQITSKFTLIIDQGLIKGTPTMVDSTVYTQIIEHDILSGSLKVTEQEHKVHKLHTFIEFTPGPDGDVVERLVFNEYTDQVEDRTESYRLQDFMTLLRPAAAASGWEASYGKNIILFETGSSSAVQAIVTNINGIISTTDYNSGGEVTSQQSSVYQSTDYSSPDLKLRMILVTKQE